MYAKAILKAMLGGTPIGVVPTHLIPVDRICLRWASSVGSGLESTFEDELKSRAPPLDDELATVVDQMILRAPFPYPKIIKRWYRTPTPTYLIAQNLGMSERRLEYARVEALEHLYNEIVTSENRSLLRMLRVRV